MAISTLKQFIKDHCDAEVPRDIYIAWLINDQYHDEQNIHLAHHGNLTPEGQQFGGVEGIAKISKGRWVWGESRDYVITEIKRRANWKFKEQN